MEAERGDQDCQQEVKEELIRLPVPESLSETSKLNSTDELVLLRLASHFQVQFSILYPDRKPLLLCPANQYGVQKFVCSTVRPSPPGHLELYCWQGCSSFVSDYLRLEPLDPPTELPRSISSPSLVLQRQSASCFESSILLCCLLLGANYDAYCVSGYAVREMCEGNQSWKPCPLEENTLQDETVSLEQELKQGQDTKYFIKPQRELKSRHLTELEMKKREDGAAEVPVDPLRGLRVHCWVLVLSGSHGIEQNFFIEPLSGNRFPTDSTEFLGIESLWNDKNYYINLQDCSSGCAEVEFDLSDRRLWEPVLPLEHLRRRGLTPEEEQQIGEVLELPVLILPRPWISPITGLLSDRVLHTLPGGHKEILYWKSKLEKFDPWSRLEGLSRRWTIYGDENHSEVTEVKEWFVNRSDFLQTREVNMTDGWFTERFTPTTQFPVLLFKCRPPTSPTDVLTEFSILHLSNVRRRLLTPCEMLETFEDRGDFLYQRRVVFKSPEIGKLPLKQFEVVEVEEHFHRNESRPATEDMAIRRYLRPQKRIEVTYHLMEGRLIPSQIVFKNIYETSPCASTFQVDSEKKSPLTMTVRQTLRALLDDFDVLMLQVQESLKEVGRTLVLRGKMEKYEEEGEEEIEEEEEEKEKDVNKGPSADKTSTRWDTKTKPE